MNSFHRLTNLCLALFVLVLAQGCSGSDDSQAQSGDSTASEDIQLFQAEANTFAGSHILIAYAGAMRADSSVTRSKEEAQAKAADLIEEINENPESFEDLAREHSDGPSGVNGGDLGSWAKGRMVPEFDTAIEALEIGDVAQEPVETAFGYHVMRRNDARAPYFGADAFIIGIAGPRAPETVTRDSAAAATLAEEIKGKIDGDNFEELAIEYNDFGEGPMFIGGFKDGDPVAPEILELIKSLDYNEVGGPLELPVGLAFLHRVKLEQRTGSHILIAYAGASQASPEITRSKEEAQAEAERVLQLAKANPDNFAELAAEHSDGPSKVQGGSLGYWFRGAMVPEFDEAIDTMDAGEISDAPIETDFGFHIIKKGDIGS